MTVMKEQCVYACGPYRDYCGRAEYDEDAKIFHGEVIGTRDVITFEGTTLEELREAFQASVDDYLSFCESLGQSPEKPFSGQFVARMSPELHRRVSMMAQAAGKSLNQFLCDCLEAMTTAGIPAICQPPAKKSGRPAVSKRTSGAVAVSTKTRIARAREQR
jgi:predicted HicB family RNase H-like nuclease